MRIDKFLDNRIAGVSRNKIQEAAKAGYICANGNVVKQNYRVHPYDVITVNLPGEPVDFKVEPEDIPLDIVYEDDTLIVSPQYLRRMNNLFAYALACAEENASGGEVVTAPTCGSCGVVPAICRLIKEIYQFEDTTIIHALATAGLFGNLAKANASISGAEVGCQGEIGVACAMAAAAACQLEGGDNKRIAYAAEMGLEHHLGLTCDPVDGLVQIPCIERNALAASRALDCATYALMSDGEHRVSYDDVLATMMQTGLDMNKDYRETARGGLARFFKAKLLKLKKKTFRHHRKNKKD